MNPSPCYFLLSPVPRCAGRARGPPGPLAARAPAPAAGAGAEGSFPQRGVPLSRAADTAPSAGIFPRRPRPGHRPRRAQDGGSGSGGGEGRRVSERNCATNPGRRPGGAIFPRTAGAAARRAASRPVRPLPPPVMVKHREAGGAAGPGRHPRGGTSRGRRAPLASSVLPPYRGPAHTRTVPAGRGQAPQRRRREGGNVDALKGKF